MNCKDCYARNDSEKCLIGKKPRMLVCGHYGCDMQKKNVEKKMGIYTQTNGDKIRQMSDEELADEILDWYATLLTVEWTREKIVDLLRQEATDDEC